MKTLIVVSGGDAPGINALIARYIALTNTDNHHVIGANGGFAGVMNQDFRPLTLADVSPLVGLGGSIIASSREPVLAAEDAREQLTAILHKHEIDNILLFGGNGTLRYIPPLLNSWNIPTIGIPTTIDNDIAGTNRTLGFDSACNYAYQSVEGVLATARALPGRIFMIETLGGDTGYLALDIALGAGAHIVLLPEYDYDEDWFVERIKTTIAENGYSLVILSEGVKTIPQMESMIPERVGIRLRYTRLGHAQRGGIVTHVDRRLAMDMARIAYQGFLSGKSGVILLKHDQMILYKHGINEFELSPPDKELYNFVNGLN